RMLFPEALSAADAVVPAPLLGSSPWHYRAVDIKYSTIHLDASGHTSCSDHAAYLAQVFVYTRALGSLQGFEPRSGYLLGRSWHAAKREIAHAQRELTQLWQLGVTKRDDALARGVRRSDQSGLSAQQLGLAGSYGRILDRLLAVNNDATGPAVQPPTIRTGDGR